MKKSTLVFSLLCLGCFLAIHKVNGAGESDYPGIVSISNSDPDTPLKGTPNSCLGQYAVMEGESSHGAPVYKHKEREKRFFFLGKNKFWYCSYTHGPTAGGFFSASRKKGAWTRYTGPKSISYEGLVGYPDVVSISNSDPDAKMSGSQRSCLGQYSLMEGESSHGAPVYKHNDNAKRFFFLGKNKAWYCSYTHGPTAGGFLWASWKKGAWTDGAWTKGAWTMKSSPKSFIIKEAGDEDEDEDEEEGGDY